MVPAVVHFAHPGTDGLTERCILFCSAPSGVQPLPSLVAIPASGSRRAMGGLWETRAVPSPPLLATCSRILGPTHPLSPQLRQLLHRFLYCPGIFPPPPEGSAPRSTGLGSSSLSGQPWNSGKILYHRKTSPGQLSPCCGARAGDLRNPLPTPIWAPGPE